MTRQEQAQSRSRPLRGFSLVEVACVVVIIGALSAIAVPRLSNSIALSRVDAAARRIVVDLDYAKREAIRSSTNQRVRFRPLTDEYSIEGLLDPDHPGGVYVVSLQDEPYGATIVSVNFPAGNAERVIFDIYGVPDSGGSVVISVGNYTRTITIGTATANGKATVQ